MTRPPDDAVVIGPPSADDVGAIASLFAEDLADLGLRYSSARLEQTAARLTQADAARCWFRVARPSPEAPAAGVIVAHLWESVKFAGPAFWIETLYVGKPLRRRGLGRRLVTDLLEHAREIGAAGVDLESYQMNAPASYLYRALGFRRIGRERYSFRIGD